MCRQIRFARTRDHKPRLIRRAASLPEKAQVRSGLKAGLQLPLLTTHNSQLVAPAFAMRLCAFSTFGLRLMPATRMSPSRHTNTPASQASRIIDYRVTLYCPFDIKAKVGHWAMTLFVFFRVGRRPEFVTGWRGKPIGQLRRNGAGGGERLMATRRFDAIESRSDCRVSPDSWSRARANTALTLHK